MKKNIFYIIFILLNSSCLDSTKKTINIDKTFCNSSNIVNYVEIICELEFNNFEAHSFLVPSENSLSPFCYTINANINDSLINVFVFEDSNFENEIEKINTIITVKYLGIGSITTGWIYDEMYYFLEENDTLNISPVLNYGSGLN
ncbi:MAG: hypothetical protein JXL97_17690 [Bacteroidales bacterium]|nr:hypothetical protein [Bacteroidales bacterium]